MYKETNIENFRNEEIKNMIIDLNTKQLNIVKKMSYYYLIGKIAKMIHELKIENTLENINTVNEKEIINKSLNIIVDSFNTYHINISDKEIIHQKDILVSARKKLYKLINSLYGYNIELSYIKEILDYKIIKSIGKENKNKYKINKRDIDYLINKINNILEYKRKDYDAFIKLISNILLILPFRMTKSKYYEVLKETLMRNFKDYPIIIVENEIEKYKRIFDSTLLGDYGILFDEFFTSIQKLKNKKLDYIESDKVEDIKKNIEDLDNRINHITTIIIDLGIIINRLLVLYLGIEKGEYINEDEIYLKFKKFEKDKDMELLNNLMNISVTALKKYEEELISKTQYYEKLVKESIKRGILFEDELNDEMKLTKQILTFYNDIEFTKYELLLAENYEIIKENYLEQLINSLIYYINRSISSMDNLERKIRMRRLLSAIELPFKNIDEFLQYAVYAFDERLVSMDEIIFAFFSLNQLLDSRNQK